MEFPNQVYDSSRRPHPLLEEFRAVWTYRNLIQQFIARSLKTRYKRSVLGIVWTMLNPLLTMIVLTLVFSNIFRFSIQYYPVYILSGLVVWNFFSSTTAASMNDMLFSGSLLSRIYVPKSVFAVSAIGTGLVNLAISLIPLAAIALAMGIRFDLSILTVPLAVMLLVVFSLGVGLILSTAAVFFADMLPVYDVILTIWMYATPIIYPIEIVPPQFAWAFKLNPLYYLVTLFRQPIFSGTVPGIEFWITGGLSAVLTFAIGAYLFTARSNEYAYRI